MKAALFPPTPREPVPAVPPTVNGGAPLRYGGLQGDLHRRVLRDIPSVLRAANVFDQLNLALDLGWVAEMKSMTSCGSSHSIILGLRPLLHQIQIFFIGVQPIPFSSCDFSDDLHFLQGF